MEQGAEAMTSPPDTAAVHPVGTSGNCRKAEPQMSCGDSQQTDPKTSYVLDKGVPNGDKTLGNEPGRCSIGEERRATFQIGEQCLTGLIPRKVSTSELSPVWHKSATFPIDTKGRCTVAGSTPLSARHRPPDCVLPSVDRALSPTLGSTMNTIDSLVSATWGSTFDPETSLWLPDASFTPLDKISEYEHTAKPKRVPFPGDMDHTCSAVCADDPTCVTYHTMADTVTSVMPIPSDKGYLSSTTIDPVRPIPLSVNPVAPLKVAANVNLSPQNKKRPPFSVHLALFTAFKNSVSPVIFHEDGIQSISKQTSRKVEERTEQDTNKHGRPCHTIPIYTPTPSTTVSALSTALPTSTAVILGDNAFQNFKNGGKYDKSVDDVNTEPKTAMTDMLKPKNPTMCSLGIPQRNLNQTQSALSAILIPSTAPILAESMETHCFDENTLSSLMDVERKRSVLRSLLLTATTPVLGREVDTVENPGYPITNDNTDKRSGSRADTHQPEVSPSPSGLSSVLTDVPNYGGKLETNKTAGNVAGKPVDGSLMSLASRRHENFSCMALSRLLVTTTAVVLGEAVEGSCVELTEIELSEKEPETEAKVNHTRSFLDIMFCRRRK